MSFGGDTKSRWSLLSGVYARGSKRSHQSALDMQTGGNFTSVWKQDTRIQKFEEDGSQWDGEAALQGRGSGICRFVGQHLSGKGAAVFAEGLSGAVASGLGKVRYFN